MREPCVEPLKKWQDVIVLAFLGETVRYRRYDEASECERRNEQIFDLTGGRNNAQSQSEAQCVEH